MHGYSRAPQCYFLKRPAFLMNIQQQKIPAEACRISADILRMHGFLRPVKHLLYIIHTVFQSKDMPCILAMARKVKGHHGHASVLGQNILRIAGCRMIVLMSTKSVTENHHASRRSRLFGIQFAANAAAILINRKKLFHFSDTSVPYFCAAHA